MEIQGIDVSKWQGDIDWAGVKAAGIRFAMVRASFGQSDADPSFVQNITQAQANGIPCGAYHYCYAKSVDEALKEAEFFLKTVKSYQLDYPLALDLEDGSLEPLGREALTEIAGAFLKAVSFLRTRIGSSVYWSLRNCRNMICGFLSGRNSRLIPENLGCGSTPPKAE